MEAYRTKNVQGIGYVAGLHIFEEYECASPNVSFFQQHVHAVIDVMPHVVTSYCIKLAIRDTASSKVKYLKRLSKHFRPQGIVRHCRKLLFNR